MSEVGYYRYKTIADIEKVVTFGINGTLAGEKNIFPIESCTDDILIKYLDKNGQYRFYPFNDYYRTFDDTKKIGSSNKFITNIKSGQTSSQNIGFRNSRKIEISTDIEIEKLEKVVDLYTSPRVYYYIGANNSDAPADWLEVDINVSDSIIRPRKKNTTRIDITITLPENYGITMI